MIPPPGFPSPVKLAKRSAPVVTSWKGRRISRVPGPYEVAPSRTAVFAELSLPAAMSAVLVAAVGSGVPATNHQRIEVYLMTRAVFAGSKV
jgi:hypothetical protein